MTHLRRFPFGQEPAPMRLERAPVVQHLTMPLADDGGPSRPVLPFRVAVIAPPPVVHETPPAADDARERPRARRWIRIAFVVVGLVLYVGAVLAIVAPDSWWP